MSSTTKTQQETKDKKAKPTVDLMPKWKLEEQCFKDAKIKDIKTGQVSSWPYIENDVTRRGFQEHFLDKVVDPDTGYYYPKRDEEGKPVKTTPDNIPKYVVRVIIRLNRRDSNTNSEFLLSKGDFIGYDALGDPVKNYVSCPEVWGKTHFIYEKDLDAKRKLLVKNCKGPGEVEQVYTLPFNEKNLKELFDKRRDDNTIQFVVKDEVTGTVRAVSAGPNINDTFTLFLKPFAYLYNAEYIPAAMKAQYRQEAIDAGLLTAAPATGTGVL